MKPKLLLGLSLVLSGGLTSLALDTKDTVALFPITEMPTDFDYTNFTSAFTNASILENLAKKMKFGFIDQSGAVVILTDTGWLPGPLPEDKHFAEGLEPVRTRWTPGMTNRLTWGYLDEKGKLAIEPQFTLTTPFSEGLAAVRDVHYGYIDHSGKYVIMPQFEEAFGFSEGLAEVVDTNHLMGFVDRSGKWVIKPQFQCFSKSSSFTEGLACVATNDVTVKFPFESASNPEFKWGYVNKKGELVIGFKFKEANAFSEGLAAVTETNKGGYIDRTGKFVIPPQFDGVWNFSEGLARVEVRGQMEFINKHGNVVFIVTNGVWAGEFSEGRANVWLRKAGGGEIWGYIDSTGHFVIKPQFQRAEPFYNGLAEVGKDNKPAYIDKSGRCVWKEP